MSLPPNQTVPDDDPQLPAARRRQAQRNLFGPLNVDERSRALEQIARKAAPSFDFFLYSFFAGAIIGTAYLFESPYLLLLGSLIAPYMAPAVGVALGTSLGSPRHFARSMVGLLIGCLLVMSLGWLAGLAKQGGSANQAHIHAQLDWPALLILAIGAILLTSAAVDEERNPDVASFLVTYGLFTPIAAAGFGLGNGAPFLWPDGLVVFVIHLAWAILCGAITLAIIGFRPPTLFGYSLSATLLLGAFLLFIGFTGAGAVFGARFGLPTLTPSATQPPTSTVTATQTSTRTSTLTPSRTSSPSPSLTPSPSPTPIIAIIDAEEGSGAFVREEPAGIAITSLLNGQVVHLLPEPLVAAGGQLWVHIYMPERDEFGWILQSLLSTATPQPSRTPTP